MKTNLDIEKCTCYVRMCDFYVFALAAVLLIFVKILDTSLQAAVLPRLADCNCLHIATV